MVAMAVDTDMVATARGLPMLRPSLDTAMAEDTEAMVVVTDMAVATTAMARGLLMLSPRLMLLLRLSLAMATVMAVDTDMEAMAATGVAVMDTTARGRLRLSLA